MARWTLALVVMSAAHAAAAAPGTPPIKGAVIPERAAPDPQSADDQAKPVDVHIPLGRIAIASMAGVWLRRGPTLRHKPILASPIVVGDAVTLSLSGSW